MERVSSLHPASSSIQSAASGALTVSELRKRLDEESRAADDVEARLEELNRDHAIIQGTMSHQRRKRQNTLDPLDKQLAAAKAELDRLQADLGTIDGRLADDERQVRTYEAAKRAQAIRYAEAFVPRISTREDQLLADAVAHEMEQERARLAEAERVADAERRRAHDAAEAAAAAAAAAEAAAQASQAAEKAPAKAATSTSARIPRTGSRGRPAGGAATTVGATGDKSSERPRRRRRSTSGQRVAGGGEADQERYAMPRKASESGNRPRPPNAPQRRTRTSPDAAARTTPSASQSHEQQLQLAESQSTILPKHTTGGTSSQSAAPIRGDATAVVGASSTRSDASTRRHARGSTSGGSSSSLRVGIVEPVIDTTGAFGGDESSQSSPARRKSRSGRPPKGPASDGASPRRRSRAASQRHRPEEDSSLDASSASPKNPDLTDDLAAEATPTTPEPDVGEVVPYAPVRFDHSRVYGTYYQGAAHPCRRNAAPDYEEQARVRRVTQQQADDEAAIERDRLAFEASRASVKEMLRRVAPPPRAVAQTRPRPPSAPLAPLGAGDVSALAWRPELHQGGAPSVPALSSLSSRPRPNL